MTSNGSIPVGLTLYTFDYPEGYRSEETYPVNGLWVSNPSQCFLNSDRDAAEFMQRFGATKATNVLTGTTIHP